MSPTLDPVWWITAVEIPVLAGLFWLIWRGRQSAEALGIDLRHRLEMELGRIRQALADYKLEVAKSYASIAYLKDVEDRLTAHLLRIEAKLDVRGEI